MQIQQIAEQEKLPSLFLDSGGLLFAQPGSLAGQEEQTFLAAEGIAEAMQAMNCRAAGIAAHDLAGGVELLKKLQQESGLTWLSLNLVDTKSRKPVFAPSLTVAIAGLSVAVLGLTDEQAVPAGSGYAVLPWQEVLPKAAAAAADKADMIILLSSAPYEVNKKIAETAPAIDLILASGHDAAMTHPVLSNDTLFAQTGARGKYLGMMRISWTEAGRWAQDFSTLRAEQDRLDQISSQLEQAGIKEAAKDTRYQTLLAEKKQIELKLKALREQRTPQDDSLCRFSNQFIALESSLPEDPKVQEIIARAKQKFNDLSMKRVTTDGLAAPLKVLAGSQQCGKCHAAQEAFWRKTAHASCMKTLISKNQQFNEECLLCHVTLPYYDLAKVKAERLLAQLPEKLQNVGCESCHGPAAAHAENPTSARAARPTEQTCKACHTPEQDDGFVFAGKVRQVRCPNR